MCDPTIIALAVGMGAAGATSNIMRSRKTNELAEEKARTMMAQAAGQQSGVYAERAILASNTAREAFQRRLAKAEVRSQFESSFAGIHGTPYSDSQRKLKNSAQDAEWQLREARKIRVLGSRDKMDSIFLRLKAGLTSLPTSSVAEQVVGVASTAVKSATWAYTTHASLNAPSNKDIAADKTSDALKGPTELKGHDALMG